MNYHLLFAKASDEHRAHGFVRGLGHGLKSFILFFWHAIPIHHFYSAYHWGVFVGVYIVPLILLASGGHRYTVRHRLP